MQVVGGELKNLIGRIVSINEMIRSVTLAPFNSALKSEIVIEVDLLVKYIVAGAHIKVRTVPHRTVLYCTALHCIVLYCMMLYSAVLYCIVLYCNVCDDDNNLNLL